MTRFNINNLASAKREWSSQQESIFSWFAHGSGHLLVRARAGTGKTTTLVEGVQRAPERSVCVAAFNKSIADELKKQFDGTQIKAMTLHGLGFRFIKANMPKAQVDSRGERARTLARAGAAVIQARESKAKAASGFIIQRIANYCTWIREMLGDPRSLWSGTDVIGNIENWLVGLEVFDHDDLSLPEFWTFSKMAEAAIEAVTLAKEETETIDFADMIFLPQVRGWIRPIYSLMVVDEAQDMTRMQLGLGLAACRGRVCLVGDDRQAIYGFRGADIGCLDRLKDQLKAQELGLTITYRCPHKVVEVANLFVEDLQTHEDASRGVVNDDCSLEDLKKAEAGDFVLSRTNKNLAEAFLHLVKCGKRAYIKGSDYGRHMLQFIKKFQSRDLADLSDEVNGWTEKTAKKMSQQMKATTASARKLKQLMDDCGLLSAFIAGSRDYDDLLKRLGSSFSDTVDPQAVVCSTVHKAKGLEAKTVWLLGSTFRTYCEEEENICYVAITRAKDTLNLIGERVIQDIFGASFNEPDNEGEFI
jgi:superfamily I DNA/RNA helicase